MGKHVTLSQKQINRKKTHLKNGLCKIPFFSPLQTQSGEISGKTGIRFSMRLRLRSFEPLFASGKTGIRFSMRLRLRSFEPLFASGKTGIRTPEPVSPVTRFPGVPLQPLEHLSFLRCDCKINLYRAKHRIFFAVFAKTRSFFRHS